MASGWRWHVLRVLVVSAILLLIIGIQFRLRHSSYSPGADQIPGRTTNRDGGQGASGAARFGNEFVSRPEEIVARKVAQFGRSRREIVGRLAKHHGREVPAEIERFFEAMERGNWEEIDQLFQAMAKRSAQYEGSTHDESLDPFWPAVLEAYGGAEQAHLWPAKQLLDYGEGILGALKPGMVYIGGTDSGRFIPTLINETSSGEQHVILTQNAMADSRYMEYVRFLYGDRIRLPGTEGAQQAFADYIADAQKRSAHDQQFPNEPKQIRRNERVWEGEGRVAVSGSTAVMDINERLVQQILEANPEMSFAMQESFPFKKTYAEAAPLGPIMELRAGGVEAGEGSERDGAKTLEYWQGMKEQLLQNPEAAGSDETLKAYSKMTVGHANLLAGSDPARAEEIYRLATEIFPRNTDAVIGLAEFLQANGRGEAAQELVRNYAEKNPELKKDVEWLISEAVSGGPSN